MKDGGAIQVEVNDAKDITNRDKIRTHLTEIAKMFQNGIFTTPFAVHGQVPPGVPEMDQLKNEIRYRYEETEKGARVRITTANPKALAAVHSFLSVIGFNIVLQPFQNRVRFSRRFINQTNIPIQTIAPRKYQRE